MALLKKERRYGLELVEFMNRLDLEISEGSIYPLLSRLKNDGKITSTWVDEGSGHSHKYYNLTPLGETALQGMVRDWRNFSSAFNQILEGLHE
jgi:PadR family transcriptional regulator PadR